MNQAKLLLHACLSLPYIISTVATRPRLHPQATKLSYESRILETANAVCLHQFMFWSICCRRQSWMTQDVLMALIGRAGGRPRELAV